MLNREFLGHLREAHRAVWHHDHLYRLAVLALPVVVVFAVMSFGSGRDKSSLWQGKEGHASAPSLSSMFPNAETKPPPSGPGLKPSMPAVVQSIAPGAALPANSSPAAGSTTYQSPFNQ